MVRGIARTSGLRIEALFREVDGYEAGCLVYVRRRGPLSQVVVPPFCFYSAVILPPDASADIRSRLLRELLGGVHGICPDANVVLPPGAGVPSPGRLPDPWTSSEFRTYRAPVRPLDEAVQTWSGGTRRRFAKHAGDYDLDWSVESVPDILSLVSDAYQQHGRGLPVGRSDLEGLIRRLYAAGHADVVSLRDRESGRTVAGMVLMVDDRTGWDWIAGSVRGPGMTVCIGRAFERLRSRGVQTFDFGGANIEAIATFKRQFGGEEATYPSLSTPERPLVRWLSGWKSRLTAGG
ncbi:MAG: GNAT family N-acetyltransferase [Rhodothermales bacterium]|nr:GNAT family N-acetyltransferase [Rhodothermales bacterium]